LFPDRDRILDDFRPEEVTDEAWDFFGIGFDHLAEGLHAANIDQVDSLVIDMKQLEGNRWVLTSDFVGKNGRSGRAEYEGELSKNPIDFLWKKLEGSKEATEWLGLDLGFKGVD
ncbi:MAG: hypothetical protein KC931_26045, partial [Candidatus Omnitrophica bacterium]|nr:hypothetical protein [Candidatus Omnitrophota bacterium]